MTGRAEDPLIFLVAGEPSGDQLGGRLMAALRTLTDDRIRFAGVGAEDMAAQGLQSIFPMSELSVMGVLEVVPRIPRILRRIRETSERARALAPAAVVTIDSPDFSFRVSRRLAGCGFPLIHYVAPQVWAHRPGRVHHIARFLDHVLALLPFEPPYFEAAGLACSFVGHSVVEAGADDGDGAGFRARHGIAPDTPLLCSLPGSRHSEVSHLLPVFGETLTLLAGRFPGLETVVPTAPAVHDRVAAAAAAWSIRTHVVSGVREKYDAFAASSAALAASGTVVLELAIAGLPAVVTYKASWLTGWAARHLIRVPYVSLVNLILDRPVMPELMQERCRPDLLADEVSRLIEGGEARERQLVAGREAAGMLGLGGKPPSRRAAEVVLDVIAGRGSRVSPGVPSGASGPVRR